MIGCDGCLASTQACVLSSSPPPHPPFPPSPLPPFSLCSASLFFFVARRIRVTVHHHNDGNGRVRECARVRV